MNPTIGAAVTVAVLALAACSEDPNAAVSVDELREVATDAGETPPDCPLDYDLTAALGDAGVDSNAVLDRAEAFVSDNATPPPDPIEAQTEDGMSPLEVAAGSSIRCVYTVEDGDVDVSLATSIQSDFPAHAIFAQSLISADDELGIDDIDGILERLEQPGSTEITPNGAAVLTTLSTTEDRGTAALYVVSDAISGEDLRSVANRLAADIDES